MKQLAVSLGFWVSKPKKSACMRKAVTRGSERCPKLYSLEDFAFVNLVYTVVFSYGVVSASDEESGKLPDKTHRIGSSS